MALHIFGQTVMPGEKGSMINVTVDMLYTDREKFLTMLFEVMRDNKQAREFFIGAVSLYMATDKARAKKFSTVMEMIMRQHNTRKGPPGKLVGM